MSSGELEAKKSGDFYWSKDEVRATHIPLLLPLLIAHIFRLPSHAPAAFHEDAATILSSREATSPFFSSLS